MATAMSWKQFFSFFFKVGEVAPFTSFIYLGEPDLCLLLLRRSIFNMKWTKSSDCFKSERGIGLATLNITSSHLQGTGFFLGHSRHAMPSLVPPGFPEIWPRSATSGKCVRVLSGHSQAVVSAQLVAWAEIGPGSHGMPWDVGSVKATIWPQKHQLLASVSQGSKWVFPTRSEYLRNMTPKIRHPMIFHWL